MGGAAPAQEYAADSAGIAVRNHEARLQRIRSVSKVAGLQHLLDPGARWRVRWGSLTRAGPPTACRRSATLTRMSGEQVAIVHNGIIENHAELHRPTRHKVLNSAPTPTLEVIAHLLAGLLNQGQDICEATQRDPSLVGAYALAVLIQPIPSTSWSPVPAARW